MWYWIIGVVIAFIALYIFVDREIYFYEATHLGARVQSWLYDRWAAKYDTGKKESIARDKEMLAKPVLDFLKDVPAPLLLDLATGTGRLPLALLKESEFKGHIVAVDVSAGMLAQSAQKLKDYQGRFTLLRKLNYPLPFPDGAFDVVSCMEALEVMPEMDSPLAELFRILKPGGMLLTSHATADSGRKTKILSVEDFKKKLNGIGFENVEVVDWWRWFDRAIARKPGNFSAGENSAMQDIFLCESCLATGLSPLPDGGMECPGCGKTIPQNEDGTLLM